MMNYHRPPGSRDAHDPLEWLWNANVVTHTNPLLRRSCFFQFLRAGLVGLYNRGRPA